MYLAFEKPQNKHWKRSRVVRKLEGKYEWCFSRLKCKKICVANAITSQTAKKKKKKKKAEITYLEGRKQQTRYRLTFSDNSRSEKRYYWSFENERRAWNVNVTFFAIVKNDIGFSWCIWSRNLLQDSYGWCISSYNVSKREKEHN